MEKLKAIIIDDMEQAIASLKADLADYCPQVEVIATADGVVSGAKLLKQQEPDVVFLDIQLQDGSGFDILELVPDLKAPVIFTTASDAFAIKAFRFSATDYLMKPIDPDELVTAVEKVSSIPATSSQNRDLLVETIQSRQRPKKLALHTLEKIQIVAVEDIVRCESNGNYTQFYFSDGDKLLVTRTLKEFDQLLEEYGFLRTHQSHLVNAEYIKEFTKTEGGYLLMKDDSRVPVSTRKRAIILQMLEGL